jgi:hypothetical protein
MDLSSGQQRGLFVVVVVVLAGLGIYLIGPGGRHGSTGAPSSSPSPSVSPASTPDSSAGTTPTVAPVGTSSVGKGQADIYNWLPFTQQDLTSAAQAALAFAADYGTWSYTESSTAYGAKMNGVATGSLITALRQAYQTPGSANQRTAQKQVSTASGGITQLRSFTAQSITFLVNIAAKLTSTQGTKTNTTQYAITCVPGAGAWQVNDIEFSSAGNLGVGN